MLSVIKILGFFTLILYVYSIDCLTKESFIGKYKAELGVSTWEAMMSKKVLIGKGVVGTVSKIPLASGKFLVLKQQDYRSESRLKKQRAEVTLQDKLWNGPAKDYVPRIYGCVAEDEKFNIFMEYLPYSLSYKFFDFEEEETISNDALENFKSFPEHVRFYYYKLMFENLEKIHEAKYVHNDVKPPNILFEMVPNPTIKIIDFGFTEPFDNYPRGGTPIYNDAIKVDLFLSLRNAADRSKREELRLQYKERKDNYMADIWALAVTILWIEQRPSSEEFSREMFSEKEFMQNFERLAKVIRDAKWLENRKLNFCADSEGPSKPKVCFIDVIRRMTGYDRKPVVDTWSIASGESNLEEELSEAEEDNEAQPPITMKDLVEDMHRIFSFHSEKMKAELADFKLVQTQIEREKNKHFLLKAKDWVFGFLASLPSYFRQSQRAVSEIGDGPKSSANIGKRAI